MRYIIAPKLDEAADIVSEADDRIDPETKFQSYQELSRLRKDPGFQSPGTPNAYADFENVAREIVGPGIKLDVIASPENKTVATGLTIIDTDEDGVSALLSELHQSTIIPEISLDLIEADTLAGEVAEEASDLTEADLWHLKAIGLKRAQANGFRGTGDGVAAAVLDTGIANIPELHGKVLSTYDLDTEEWKVVPQAQMRDTYGHGTMVAGLIAGDNVGVAPGARLSSVILLPNGRANLVDYILAIEWVASQPNIQVINMSAGKLGYYENMRLITRVLRRIHTIAFMAIGNEGPDTSRSPGNYPEVISVGASNAEQQIWRRSGGGKLLLDKMNLSVPKLVAPGEDITTCVKEGEYKRSSGTSLATPILSGIACLMIERFPKISLTDLELEILSACEDLGLDPERQGRGQASLPLSLIGC